MAEKVMNKRLATTSSFRIRKTEVLPQWETGKQIENLDECIAYAERTPGLQEARIRAEGGQGRG